MGDDGAGRCDCKTWYAGRADAASAAREREGADEVLVPYRCSRAACRGWHLQAKERRP